MLLTIVMFISTLNIARSQTADYCNVNFCSMFNLGKQTMCLYPTQVINLIL